MHFDMFCKNCSTEYLECSSVPAKCYYCGGAEFLITGCDEYPEIEREETNEDTE